jgi:hypothetical protein
MSDYLEKVVSSVRELLDAVARDTDRWKCEGVRPWFRGQSNAAAPRRAEGFFSSHCSNVLAWLRPKGGQRLETEV